ncbi:MAG: hypothetical protein E7454_01465 [Ruminococcaceae bacterium]|nr:hypothetical protein [Oscillospiraceae bacterium]
MEREEFFSGYCRCMDASRMVAVLLTDGQLNEADCNYGGCPYEMDCVVAQKITELIRESSENRR